MNKKKPARQTAKSKNPSETSTQPRHDISELESALGYAWKNRDLLTTALTHPSAVYEGAQARTNQRLEFLGDAVLQLALTHELYERFESSEEGALTKARARLVNRRTLADLAKKLGIGPHLIIGRGEEQQGGRERQSCLGDAFEAVLGAIYLDSDFETAHKVVLRLFADAFKGLEAPVVIDNPKGELQEFLQAKSLEGPVYEMESVTGPDHDRVFVCRVCHSGTELGRGRGKSKKDAESQAAHSALAHLRSSKH